MSVKHCPSAMEVGKIYKVKPGSFPFELGVLELVPVRVLRELPLVSGAKIQIWLANVRKLREGFPTLEQLPIYMDEVIHEPEGNVPPLLDDGPGTGSG